MLQKTYSIYSDDLNDVQLFIEAGKNHIACWCKKINAAALSAFEFFVCDDYDDENIEELIDNARLHSRLLTMPVVATNFFWNTVEVLCFPKEKNDADFLKANFEIMFGNTFDKKTFAASTPECLVAWSIKNRQQETMQESFRGAAFNHQFIPLLSSFHEKNNTVYLFFYPHYFTLAAFKASKLQVIQTVKYNSPEDVLYFVLNVYQQYSVERNTEIFCGGFIDGKSKLFELLHQYFDGLQLMKTDENLFAIEEFKQYPTHYFLPYINYAV